MLDPVNEAVTYKYGFSSTGDTGGDKGDEDMGKLPYDKFAKKRMEQKLAREKERGFQPGQS